MSALLILVSRAEPNVAALDAMAVKRDVAGISKLYGARVPTKFNPLSPMRGGGSYGVGRFGWHAYYAASPDKTQEYVVFSTPLTSEDIGERVFEWKNGKLERYVDEADGGGWSIKSHAFEVRFDLPNKKTTISDRVELKQQGSDHPLLMRFGPNYKVMLIRDETGKSVSFSQAGGLVILNASKEPARRLDLTYVGTVDKAGYAGAITPREAMLTNDYWYPMIARGPASYHANIHVPIGWTGVAQGEPEGKKDWPDETVWSYRMDLPVVYFSLCAGPYKPYTTTIDGRRFTIWSLQMNQGQMAIQAELYAPILKFYERFAKFPFSGYGAVDTRLYGGGALEAYSFATYGSGWLPDEDSHEPAHTWWGGIVNNTYLKSSWNESFANYCEGLYARNVEIGDQSDRSRAFVSHPAVDDTQMEYALDSAGVDVGGAAGDLGYGKGSFVLQMLEQEMGTDNLVAAMRSWIKSKPAGSVGEWEDFEKIVGLDYKWFFDEWVHRPGYAQFKFENVRWQDGKVLANVAFQGQPYRMTVDVLLQSPSGERVMRRVPVKGAESIEIPAPTKPALISVDPWRRILRPIAEDEGVPSITSMVGKMKLVVDPKHPEYAKFYPNTRMASLPTDLNGTLITGTPETVPAMGPLCDKAGFKINGDQLTYKGHTINLRKGMAMALLDLGQGRRCMISLGQGRRRPSTGDAHVAVTDDLGRFLYGETEPKTSGNLTYRIR